MKNPRCKDRLLETFWKLTKNMPFFDFCKLIRCGCDEEQAKFYMYNPHTRSVTRPQPKAVALPIDFWLTAFHRKHLFTGDFARYGDRMNHLLNQ